MDIPMLKRRDGVAIDPALIKAFQNDFHGRVIQPGDASYDTARRIWNASIDKHPGLIARCSGVADIVHAVKFAHENDLLVAVKSGGHNVGGRALCDDGIVIDLSVMKGIFVDPQLRTVRVQAGATLGDVDRETHLHGLAIPTGVVSKTGIAGLTLGGGSGWLVRKYGLTCDNLLSCAETFPLTTRVLADINAAGEVRDDAVHQRKPQPRVQLAPTMTLPAAAFGAERGRSRLYRRHTQILTNLTAAI